MPNTYFCDGCGKPFTIQEWVFRHQGHEPDCPRVPNTTLEGSGCDCGLNYHPECCPECNDDPDEIPTGDVMA